MSSQVRPAVAAVTLNWHDAPRTIECLRSVVGAPAIDAVFVVDNESTGELARAVDEAGLDVELLALPENRGFAAGTNPGLRAALESGADYVLVINNDAAIDAASVTRLVDAAENDTTLGAVAPAIVNPDGTVQTLGVRWRAWGSILEQRRTVGKVDSLTWACVLVRASALADVGLLDERFFMYWEDFEFSRRLTDHGWRLGVEPRAIAVHALSSSAERAGSSLATYHVWGLVTLAKIRRGRDRARSAVRLLALFAKRVARLDLDGLRAAVRGVRLARRPGLGYEVLADSRPRTP